MKKLIIAASFAGSMLVGVPEAKANTPEECLLHNGCYFNEAAAMWVCGNPRIYMICLEP